MSVHDRSLLPSRPVPALASRAQTARGADVGADGPPGAKRVLDAARLIGMTRVGAAAVAPDGRTAVFQVSDYDFAAKQANPQLWLADLALAATLDDAALRRHDHLRKLAEGKQHGWASLASPAFSPCGTRLAFLSDRGDGEKTRVWVLPVDGPGEATLLAEFPVAVGDLEWTARGGLAVSASVYVDRRAAEDAEAGKCPLAATAARDKALGDADALGGLDAVLYKRLPVREWDRWLDAKMAHPFYVAVPDNGGPVDASRAEDLLAGVPTAVPSGAFGGSEDWAISVQGHVAVSARPPLAPDEAWTTNRHIYLQRHRLRRVVADRNEDPDGPSERSRDTEGTQSSLGECLTAHNPGYDTAPAFSPDGQRLAWLTTADPTYESDAVGIRVHDVATGDTTTLLRAGADWDHSPDSLTWSKDGRRLYFTADVRSRRALCSIDAEAGATAGGGGIAIHRAEASTTLHGECGDGAQSDGSRQFLTTVQSLTMPAELFLTTTAVENGNDATTLRQLTYFNTDRISNTALGRPGEIVYKGGNGDDVQAWLIRPAGFSPEDEQEATAAAAVGKGAGKRYPLAVIYHGGPQGSSGDDWHYRWNLQYYASRGFAVLAPNFHGSTGFGHRFCRDITGDWEVGGVDTVAGVRAALAAHPWLDAGRVVGLGGSYGGFLSNWLNGHAPAGMFRALVCHCGTFDMKSSYYATDELFFKETECGGSGPPYTAGSRRPESPWQLHSPSLKVHAWKTPTLVIHGAKDYRLVESEGISTFTALQRRNVPSEFLHLPTENHHCLNPQNSMVWHETVLAWMQRWTDTDTDTDGGA